MIIYKPLATLSTPPISREKEKKKPLELLRGYRHPESEERGEQCINSKHPSEDPGHEEGEVEEEGENIDFESIDKRGSWWRSTPSRPVSTPN